MCDALELDGKFTAVDVGRINMGIVQISCRGGKLTIENWMLLDLNELCRSFDARNRIERFGTRDGKYGDDEHCHCLFKFVCEQTKPGGIFDSSVCFIEQQAFSREMKALQTAIHMAIIASKPSIAVRRNDPELGDAGIRTENCIAPAVIVSANSVKTCYAAYFPRVTETAATTASRQPWKRQRAFGVGDAVRDDVNNAQQYAQNKKQSVLYGQRAISVPRIIELLGAKMSDEQKKRFRAAKKDDIYDAWWTVMFGIESWLPAVYSRRRRGYGATCLMYGSMPQRRFRTCDALFEFCADIGTPERDVAELKTVLNSFRTSNNPDAVDELGED